MKTLFRKVMPRDEMRGLQKVEQNLNVNHSGAAESRDSGYTVVI